jgi:tRNA pseudouridine synthase 9
VLQGPGLGKGGLDLTPSDERAAPAAPEHLGFTTTDNPETRASASATAAGDCTAEHSAPEQDAADNETPPPALLPRETGHDIGLASPIPLSAEAVGVITRLRHLKVYPFRLVSRRRARTLTHMQDQEEDWARWRDTAFRGAPALRPAVVAVAPKKPPKQRVGAGKKKKIAVRPNKLGPGGAPPTPGAAEGGAEVDTNTLTPAVASEVTPVADAPPAPVFAPTIVIEPYAPPTGASAAPTYCEECFVPLAPDPAPERLYIFLHALRYTTALGTFETGMPAWAAAGWTWSGRGPEAGTAVGSD